MKQPIWISEKFVFLNMSIVICCEINYFCEYLNIDCDMVAL